MRGEHVERCRPTHVRRTPSVASGRETSRARIVRSPHHRGRSFWRSSHVAGGELPGVRHRPVGPHPQGRVDRPSRCERERKRTPSSHRHVIGRVVTTWSDRGRPRCRGHRPPWVELRHERADVLVLVRPGRLWCFVRGRRGAGGIRPVLRRVASTPRWSHRLVLRKYW